ncbi:transposase, partial [Oleibacter sp. HI0075]
MSKFNTIGIDLAKQIFQVHINDANGKKLISKKLKRSQLLDYIRQQP